jgi:hypothetical protein
VIIENSGGKNIKRVADSFCALGARSSQCFVAGALDRGGSQFCPGRVQGMIVEVNQMLTDTEEYIPWSIGIYEVGRVG